VLKFQSLLGKYLSILRHFNTQHLAVICLPLGEATTCGKSSRDLALNAMLITDRVMEKHDERQAEKLGRRAKRGCEEQQLRKWRKSVGGSRN